ncbi:MarR family winged helix-turn-helix transcriptional regulator [Nucisporomicrobium flavum]|uniref:MarR family winged helix-turn-helix transcriptional regulator n=1 Tax=Nucisporomicrobium flavum TaxID=2785915 RepID=UPI0018F5247F|nr:MarR family transcriptional regulator [Nucisporomicrobium flavum]
MSVQDDLGRQMGGRFSTAIVQFHAAVAERVGLNVSDYKCAEIIRRLGPINPARLAAATGMSTAATAQVVNRLEKAGLAERRPDPGDGRRTLVHPVEQGTAQEELGRIFAGFGARMAAVMEAYDEEQMRTLLDFVSRTTEVLEAEAVTLRRR